MSCSVLTSRSSVAGFSGTRHVSKLTTTFNGTVLPTRQQVLVTPRPARQPVLVYAKYGRYNSPDIGERLVAAVPYMLPFLDAFSYGRFLFYQYPVITRVIAPLGPVVNLYASVPFAPLISFFAVYLGIVNNQRWSRFVRFNALQAVLLDILLVLPRLLESLVNPPSSGWGLQAYMTTQNTIWIFVAVCVAYGVGSALLGQIGRIPFVADAADQQVR
eukprot:jgi/Chrzof1/12069/Cz06g20080.t1_TIC20A[v5.2]